jgi:ParB/RepB/Spo0J family partition protein
MTNSDPADPDLDRADGSAGAPLASASSIAAGTAEQGVVVMLPLDLLDPHPLKPRLRQKGDLVDEICVSIKARGFDHGRPLAVRRRGNRYEILDGDDRADAARLAGLSEVPCVIRDVDDHEAFMLLRTLNAQRGLTALERGTHALLSGMEIKAYAVSVGRPHQTVYDEFYAAEVAEAVPHVRNELADASYKAVAAIHVAPRWLWPALALAMVAGGWTVKTTQVRVAQLKNLPADPPEWLSVGFVEGLRSGNVRLGEFEGVKKLLATTAAELQEIERQRALVSGDDPPGESFGQTFLDEQMGTDGVSFAAQSHARDYCAHKKEAARQRFAEIQHARAKEKNQADGMAKPHRGGTSGAGDEVSRMPEPEYPGGAPSEAPPPNPDQHPDLPVPIEVPPCEREAVEKPGAELPQTREPSENHDVAAVEEPVIAPSAAQGAGEEEVPTSHPVLSAAKPPTGSDAAVDVGHGRSAAGGLFPGGALPLSPRPRPTHHQVAPADCSTNDQRAPSYEREQTTGPLLFFGKELGVEQERAIRPCPIGLNCIAKSGFFRWAFPAHGSELKAILGNGDDQVVFEIRATPVEPPSGS